MTRPAARDGGWPPGSPLPRVAIGCMRLPADDDAAIATLHVALAGGVDLLDTAAPYGPEESPHANERVIARALATFVGDRSNVRIATKAGLVRRGGRWIPDGRARSLVASAEASAEALGAPPDLLQWHAPDPRVDPATSARALGVIARRGLARAIGVCNVGVPDLARACDLAPIAAVQVELGPWCDAAVRSGVAEEALRRGLLLLAHTPLGGRRGAARLAREPVLAAIASRLGATPVEVALAWMAGIHPHLVPLPGPTRPETAASATRAARLALESVDRAAIDALFPRIAALRAGGERAAEPTGSGADAAPTSAEVVVLVGSPASGKSTLAAARAAEGWMVLDRDSVGGSLDGLAARLDAALAAGATRLVLDATHPTRASRSEAVAVARRRGARVRCTWLDVSAEDAQVRACRRLVARYGALPTPDEIRARARVDPHAFAPSAIFRFRRAFEAPSVEEGFAEVERVELPRPAVPAPQEAPRAVCVDLDGSVWRSRSGGRAPRDAEDLALIPARIARLRALVDAGTRVWALTWQPGIADGTLAPGALDAMLEAVRSAVGAPLGIRVCPHPAGPPICWCRKPMPGLVVALLHDAAVPPDELLVVGGTAADAALARRLGAAHVAADTFFDDDGGPPSGERGASA